jgi:hypothetical protein
MSRYPGLLSGATLLVLSLSLCSCSEEAAVAAGKLVCAADKECKFTCASGKCATECLKGSTCESTCSGGSCFQICREGATCKFTCSGGGCKRTCAGTCTSTCSGGRCTQDDASPPAAKKEGKGKPGEAGPKDEDLKGAEVCQVGKTCNFTCSAGSCRFVCLKGASCEATCSGGGCTQECRPGAKCSFTCSGGNCARKCHKGNCKATCSGHGCTTTTFEP